MDSVIDELEISGIEDRQALEDFKKKTCKNIEYQGHLEKFSWDRKWFESLEEYLIDLSYGAKDKDIRIIQEFLREKIKKIGILSFNKILAEEKEEQIDNHIQWIKDNNLLFGGGFSWDGLFGNPAAIDLIREIMLTGDVDWHNLSSNPAAIDILRENLEAVPKYRKVNWHCLSENPAAIDILKKNLEAAPEDRKVNWSSLSENPAAIDILEKNLKDISEHQKVSWCCLSANPAAIDILRKNKDKISWNTLRSNTYDYYKEKIAAFNKLKMFKKIPFRI